MTIAALLGAASPPAGGGKVSEILIATAVSFAAVAVVAQGGGMGTHGALQGCGGPADRVLLCITVSV